MVVVLRVTATWDIQTSDRHAVGKWVRVRAGCPGRSVGGRIRCGAAGGLHARLVGFDGASNVRARQVSSASSRRTTPTATFTWSRSTTPGGTTTTYTASGTFSWSRSGSYTSHRAAATYRWTKTVAVPSTPGVTPAPLPDAPTTVALLPASPLGGSTITASAPGRFGHTIEYGISKDDGAYSESRTEVVAGGSTYRARARYRRTSDDAVSAWTTSGTVTAIANVAPDFGTATVAAQRWALGTAITDLVLPAASGGNTPLAYTLSPALPAGLTFTAATRTIAGTPSAVAASATYTLTATDTDGDTDTLEFTIETFQSGSVSVQIPASDYTNQFNVFKTWQPSATVLVPAAFSEDNTAEIERIRFRSDGRVDLIVSGDTSDDLVSAWETGGSLRLQATGLDVTLTPTTPPDTAEPYGWPVGTLSAQQFAAISGGILTVTFTL